LALSKTTFHVGLLGDKYAVQRCAQRDKIGINNYLLSQTNAYCPIIQTAMKRMTEPFTASGE
jgi:hypothetical protein